MYYQQQQQGMPMQQGYQQQVAPVQQNMAMANQQFAMQIVNYDEASLRGMLAEINRNLANPMIDPNMKITLANQKEVVINQLRTLISRYNQRPQPQMYPQQQVAPTQQTSGGFNRYQDTVQQPQVQQQQTCDNSRYQNNTPVVEQPVQQQPVCEPVKETKPVRRLEMNKADIKLNIEKVNDEVLINDYKSTELLLSLMENNKVYSTYTPLFVMKDTILSNTILDIFSNKVKSLTDKANKLSTLMNNKSGVDSLALIKVNEYLTNLVNDYFSYRDIDLQIDSFIEDISELESGLDPITLGDTLYSKIEDGMSEIRTYLTGTFLKYSDTDLNIMEDFEDYLKTNKLTYIPIYNLSCNITEGLKDNTYIPKDDNVYKILESLYNDIPIFEFIVFDKNFNKFKIIPAVGRFNIKEIKDRG